MYPTVSVLRCCLRCRRDLPLTEFERDEWGSYSRRCRQCTSEHPRPACAPLVADAAYRARVSSWVVEGRSLLRRLGTRIRQRGLRPVFDLDAAVAWYQGASHNCPDCSKPVDTSRDRRSADGAVVEAGTLPPGSTEVRLSDLRVAHRRCKARRRRL